MLSCRPQTRQKDSILKSLFGLPSGERAALISTLVSRTTRSTLIGHEPLELRIGQAALGRLPLNRQERPAQPYLRFAADAILLFQPIEFGRRQHDGHKAAAPPVLCGLLVAKGCVRDGTGKLYVHASTTCMIFPAKG